MITALDLPTFTRKGGAFILTFAAGRAIALPASTDLRAIASAAPLRCPAGVRLSAWYADIFRTAERLVEGALWVRLPVEAQPAESFEPRPEFARQLTLAGACALTLAARGVAPSELPALVEQVADADTLNASLLTVIAFAAAIENGISPC